MMHYIAAEGAAGRLLPDMPPEFYIPGFSALASCVLYQEAQKRGLLRIVFKALKVAVPGDEE